MNQGPERRVFEAHPEDAWQMGSNEKDGVTSGIAS